MPTESTMFREEVLATEPSKLDEQRQAPEPKVENLTILGKSEVHMTKEMVPKSGVVTEAEHMHSEEPSSSKGDIQRSSLPLSEEILEKGSGAT